MTVKELIKELEEYRLELEVVTVPNNDGFQKQINHIRLGLNNENESVVDVI